MAATFEDMIIDVQALLHGYVRTQEQSTHLTASLSSSGLSATVADPTRISRGLAEVEDELIYVDATAQNSVADNATIAPYGRGYLGSTAVAHAANVKVTFAPMFPRVRIKRALNDTIMAVGQDLFAVGTTSFTFTPNIVTYALPTDMTDVMQVSFATVGPSKMWFPITRYRVDVNANVSAFPTGKTIDLFQPVTSGRTVQVQYFKTPSEMVNNSDPFVTTTGLLESSRDCLVYGAAARLTAGIDAAALNVQAIEANVLDDKTQPGSGAAFSRSLYQMHRQRLAEERQRYVQRYPITTHYAR